MNKNSDIMCMAKCIAGGIVLGSAIGTATAVMLKAKKQEQMKHPIKKAEHCMKEKAANAMDTVACVIQNLADITR